MRHALALGVLVSAAVAAGCDPSTLPAVGPPGAAFEPGEECATSEAGGSLCRSDADLDFDTADAPRLVIKTPGTLSNPRISCVRRHCGKGAFAVRGEYRWEEGRVGALEYKFATPLDLLDKTVSFQVYVENLVTPMNAQIAVRYKGTVRAVEDAPLSSSKEWNETGGLVSPRNPQLGLSKSLSTMPVTAIIIQVYLATKIQRGSDPWVGDIYIDDVTWR